MEPYGPTKDDTTAVTCPCWGSAGMAAEREVFEDNRADGRRECAERA